ncbi:Uncharacterised protein [Segatella copri]|nr:Uncharacterised protein [Segatella copri]
MGSYPHQPTVGCNATSASNRTQQPTLPRAVNDPYRPYASNRG